MRLLLINSNPAVSRLINLSAEKYGYEIEEFKGDDFDLNENFDITIADNEAVSDNSMLLLRESGTLGEIIYIGPKGLPKPIYANHFLQKPFLPTDFIDLVKKIEKSTKKEKSAELDAEDSNTFIDDTETGDINREEEGVSALDLDDMDSLDLPMPDDDFLIYEEEKLKDETNKSGELSEKEDVEEESGEVLDSQEIELDEETGEQEAEILAEPSEPEDEDSEKQELDIPEELKLDEDDSDEEDNTTVLDSEDIDEVKQLLDDDIASDELEEDTVDGEDLELNESNEEKGEENKDNVDEFDIEEDLLIGETNIEEAMDDISSQDEVLGGLVQESEVLEEPEDILKEIENIDEESSDLEDIEKEEETEDIEMSEPEEIEEDVSVLTEEKNSIDDILEEDLEGLFGEREEDMNVDIDEIKEELETKIVSDVKRALDKDEIREALKGLKVNISISFDEE